MKKTIAIIAVTILSLLNGMAANKEHKQMKALAKDLMPALIVMELAVFFDEDPNLVKKVAQEKHININLDNAQKNCKRLTREIEQMDDVKYTKFNSKKFEKLVLQEESKMCWKKHHLDIDLLAINKGKHASNSDKKHLIECLLKSYSPRLVSKVEAIINAVKDDL